MYLTSNFFSQSQIISKKWEKNKYYLNGVAAVRTLLVHYAHAMQGVCVLAVNISYFAFLIISIRKQIIRAFTRAKNYKW